MEKASERVGGSFFILPSSIHEILIIPDNGNFDLKTLENMVREVNATTVNPADKLTDSVYHYDSNNKVFELGEKFVDRQNGIVEERGCDSREKKSLLGELKAAKEEGYRYLSYGTSTLEHGNVYNESLGMYKEGFNTDTYLNRCYIWKKS